MIQSFRITESGENWEKLRDLHLPSTIAIYLFHSAPQILVSAWNKL